MNAADELIRLYAKQLKIPSFAGEEGQSHLLRQTGTGNIARPLPELAAKTEFIPKRIG